MMKSKEKKSKSRTKKIIYNILRLAALLPVAIFSAVLACDIAISHTATGRIYDSIDKLPANDTCLLLGTTPYSKGHKNGNPYFNYRIEATAKLYKAGKIKHIIASGDSSKNYDETAIMQRALIKRGIPQKAITRDTKGHSTIESIKSAKEHFKLNRFTVVSQQFQNERALFIAKHYNLDATAYNARDINVKKGYKVYFREKLARIKVFIDILTEN
ncbi:MAG: YdcF family protein [Bacteroidaceae bacterium]|nr:YdcF family protein [Bacteroidaceae bacterium]